MAFNLTVEKCRGLLRHRGHQAQGMGGGDMGTPGWARSAGRARAGLPPGTMLPAKGHTRVALVPL